MNVFPIGNLIILLGIMILSILALVAIGEIIGLKIRKREQSLLAGVLLSIIGFIAGGGMAPISLSPAAIRAVVGIIPITHSLSLWARVFFLDTTLGLVTSSLFLFCTWLVMSAVAVHLMKKEVEQS